MCVFVLVLRQLKSTSLYKIISYNQYRNIQLEIRQSKKNINDKLSTPQSSAGKQTPPDTPTPPPVPTPLHVIHSRHKIVNNVSPARQFSDDEKQRDIAESERQQATPATSRYVLVHTRHQPVRARPHPPTAGTCSSTPTNSRYVLVHTRHQSVRSHPHPPANGKCSSTPAISRYVLVHTLQQPERARPQSFTKPYVHTYCTL